MLSIPNSEGAITVIAKAKTTAGSTVTLTLQAAGDLASGGDTIAISYVTWTASGAGFVAGTMSSVSAVTVGSWPNSGSRTGQLSFFLANSWDLSGRQLLDWGHLHADRPVASPGQARRGAMARRGPAPPSCSCRIAAPPLTSPPTARRWRPILLMWTVQPRA